MAAVGQRFTRLLTIRPLASPPRWECVCDCGTSIVVRQCRLMSGHTRSCGCLKREVLGKSTTTHGRSHTPEHIIWTGIIARCENPRATYYRRYGGRGIVVCSRWRHSFQSFFSDMGERPSAKHTIERKDNDGDYEPTNCVWATRLVQGSNTSTNRLIVVNEQSATITEWARRLGVERNAIAVRIKRGASPEEAVSRPFKKDSRREAARAH